MIDRIRVRETPWDNYRPQRSTPRQVGWNVDESVSFWIAIGLSARGGVDSPPWFERSATSVNALLEAFQFDYSDALAPD